MESVKEPAGSASPQRQLGAIVVAAGRSLRMDGTDKVFTSVLGQPVLLYSLITLQSSSRVDAIVLVLNFDNLERGKELVTSNSLDKVQRVCLGGQRRQDSVREGLRHLGECRWVLVHDGARPLLDHSMIDRGLAAVEETGAVVAALPVKDTVKVTNSEWLVTDTLPRESLWLVQTPQIFRRDLLEEAHRQIDRPVTDDAQMVELTGHPVKVFLGSYDNIKVTTQEDLIVAEAILSSRRNANPQG